VLLIILNHNGTREIFKTVNELCNAFREKGVAFVLQNVTGRRGFENVVT
jgi:hypothetical protein